MVPNRYITSALDNMAMESTLDQIHLGHLMATIYQLMDSNNILREQLKQLSKKTRFWIGKGKKIKGN